MKNDQEKLTNFSAVLNEQMRGTRLDKKISKREK